MVEWLTKEFGLAAIAILLSVAVWFDMKDETRTLTTAYQREHSSMRENIARAIKAIETLEAAPSLSEEERLLFRQITGQIKRMEYRIDLMTNYVARHSRLLRLDKGASGED